MRTSKEWWQEVKADSALLKEWLFKQYHGERTAATRLREFLEAYAKPMSEEVRLIEMIIEQEETHADWVGGLLRARGMEPQLTEDKQERYWESTIPGIESFETGCAVAAHAEAMRLDRIREIANDPQAPTDIREVFARILPQEIFHERTFAKLAGKNAMLATLEGHERGAEALGLVP